MASLVSLVSGHPPLKLNDTGEAVRAAQIALGQAGFNCPPSGVFTEDMDMIVRRFQDQHGLKPDGRIGIATAGMLDLPHEQVVELARPSLHIASGYPHDDTSSMVAFYGDPRTGNAAWQKKNFVPVKSPWQMYYRDDKGVDHPVGAIEFHRRCAEALQLSLQQIWDKYRDIGEIHRLGMHNFSGAYNFRPIRGSSRLSTHAFGAGIDFDGAKNPLSYDQRFKYPLAEVAPIFKANGAYWGGDFKHRRDGMHFQWAHE